MGRVEGDATSTARAPDCNGALPLIVQPTAVRVILLDAVGTVLHPRRPVAEVYHETGRAFGSRRTIEQVRSRFAEALERYSGRAIWPRMDGQPAGHSCLLRADTSERREQGRWRRIVGFVFDDVPEGIEPLFDHLWNYFACPDHWRVREEFGDVRHTLESRGYRIGLASNFDHRLHPICEGIPSLQNLAYLLYSSQLGVSKPDPRFYRQVERQIGFRGASILMIGDDFLHDVTGPRRLGWQTIHCSPVATFAPSSLSNSSLSNLVPLLELLP
jgi:putative hydrolase of the HAD superfamily